MLSTFLTIYVWLYFSIFCHEMGHFLVAKAMGFSPYLVKIGMSKKVLQFKLLNSPIELRAIPNGGITYISNLALCNLKLKLTLMYLCGPLANLFLLITLYIIYALGIIESPIVTLLMTLELFLIIGNLFPKNAKAYGGIQATDGKQIIDTLTKSKQGLIHKFLGLSRYASSHLNKPSEEFFNNELETLEVVFNANALLNQHKFDEAIESLEPILHCPRFSDKDKTYVIDVLASIIINYGEKRYMEKADQWSCQALLLSSEINTLQGTRGAILVELGRYNEGKEMLLPLTESNNDRIDIAISCCYIAKADYFLGNEDKVKHWLKKAERVGVAGHVLLRIQKELDCFI